MKINHRLLIITAILVATLNLYSIDDKSLKKYDEEIAKYTKLIQANKQDYNSLYFRANAYFAIDKDDEAIADLKKATSINSSYTEAWILLAQITLDAPDAYFYKTQRIFQKGGTKKVVIPNDTINEVIYYDSSYLALDFEHGNKFVIDEKIKAATIYFDNAIKSNPKNIEPYYQKAIAFYNYFKFDDALALCKKALEIDNKNVNLLILTAKIESKLNNYDDSYEFIENALKNNSKNSEAMACKAAIEMLKGDYADALDSYKDAYKLDSKNLDIIFQKGICNYYNGNFSEAANDFNQVLIAKDNACIEAQTNKIIALFMADKSSDAIKEIAKIQNDSEHPLNGSGFFKSILKKYKK